MARKKSLRETTAATIDHWTKTVGENVYILEITRAVETERGLTTKIFFTYSVSRKGSYSSHQRVLYEQLSREQVEELFATDLQ